MRTLWMASARAGKTDFASSGIELSYTLGLVGTGNGAPYIFLYVLSSRMMPEKLCFPRSLS